MLNKFKEITGKAGLVIRQYPMVLLMSFLGAVSLMCFAHGNYNSNPNFFCFYKIRAGFLPRNFTYVRFENAFATYWEANFT